jgi:hypothetical protein
MRYSFSIGRPSAFALPGVALLGLIAIVWSSFGPLNTAKVRPATAPATTFSAIRAIDAARAVAGDERPRPLGSDAHAAMRNGLIQAFQRLGYTVKVVSGPSCVTGRGGADCAIVHNIVATRDGDIARDGLVAVSAHYDSVGAGPGIADDLANVGILLELARMDTAQPFHPGLQLIVTDGEEAGLLGAQLLTGTPGGIGNPAYVINLEARGTSGPSVMFEAGPSSGQLVGSYLGHVSPVSSASYVTAIYKLLPNDTDFSEFRRAGIPGLNFAFGEGLSRYHSPRDDVAHLSQASVQAQGDAAVGVLRGMDGATRVAPAALPGFVDVVHLAVLRWPATLAWPLAAVALLLTLAGGIVCVRRRVLTWRAWIAGTLKVLLLLGLSLALATLVVKLLRLATGVSDPWLAHATWVWVAIGALSLAPMLLAWKKDETAAASGFVGVATVQVLALVLLTFVSKGLGALLLVQSLAMSLSLCVLGATRGDRTARGVTYLIGWLVSAAVLVPALRVFTVMLSPASAAAATIPLALLLLAALPLVLWCHGRTVRRAASVVALCVGAVSIVAVAMLPTATTDDPRALNVYHVQDAEHGASWVAAGEAGYRLAPSLRSAATFSATTESHWPGSLMGQKYVTDAPLVDVDVPRLEACAPPAASDVTCLHWVVRGRFDLATVTFPANSGIRGFRFGDQQVNGVRVGGTEVAIPDDVAARGFSIAFNGDESMRGPFELLTSAAPHALIVSLAGTRFGLTGWAAEVGDHRAAFEVPKNGGDMTMVFANQSIGGTP